MLPGDPGTAPAAPKSIQEQHAALTDAEEKISPLTFPEPSVSPEYVNAMASGLRTVGGSISETGNSITGAWSGLREYYSAPESETLYEVLDPVATDGEEVSEALASAATALETFAENVESIKERWASLRTEAYELLGRIEAEGEDWDKADGVKGFFGGESGLVAENAALVSTGEKIIEDYAEYETACADAINKDVPERTSFAKMPEGDVELDPNVFYHGYEQDLSELATEWGSAPADTDHGWWVDAGAAVWDFGVGAVEDTGAMLGFHSSEGWFNQSWGDSLKEYHMDNLQSAASLVGLYDNESGEFGLASKDSVKGAWKDLAHSVVPWEEWGDRPGYVIGTALLNIGATVGGAALTATGVGAVVGVPLMAWRGMAIVDGMGGSGRGPDVDLPDLPDMPTNTPINAQVDSGQMEIIKAYMDQLVNPVYADSGDLGGGTSHSGSEGSGAGRVGVSNSQQQGDSSGVPASHRRNGEQGEATAEELRVFNELMENDPQLKERLEEHEPAFRELDSGDGSWTGGSGASRPLMDGSPGGAHRSMEADSDPHQDQRVDLSDTNEPGSRPRSGGDSTHAPASEHSRGPVAVLEREGGGSGGDGPSGRDGQDSSSRMTEDGQGRTTTAGGALTGGGPSSGGPGGSGHGPDAGQGSNDGGDQNGSQDDGTNTGGSRDGDHEGNPWDQEWNNDKLDKRYRAPVVPEARTHPLKPGDSGPPSFPEDGKRFAVDERLEPNSVWDVEGRGKFYTDGDGKIFHIDTHPGNKVDTNPELEKPRKDTKYAVDVIEHPGKKYHYETDSEARTTHAHGELQRLRSSADEGGMSLKEKNEFYRIDDQTDAGHKGKEEYPENDPYYHFEKWDGGHFFGTGFGGSGHHLNLYAQLREVNQIRKNTDESNNFYRLEKSWRELLENENNNVKVTFEAEYAGSSKVPVSVTVKHSVNGGDPVVTIFENTPDVKIEGQSRRKYGERFPSAAGSLLAGGALIGAGISGEASEDQDAGHPHSDLPLQAQ
ncbi:hypothetical protein GCM10007079_03100 [Nocardiopsis terrae]|uniref:Type VII secretion system protein EssD-like domain-containing protein n=1 Tax=Nocardiopsis terrae TaxID=372655 RepID=A0ABR9HN03_9ACTN|nr:DNA/RNA non-specific endonuclease [Nocardiopsis terrae]MBE1460361.1 hypothetical protein [Nocardiopsis terrae]GHC71045.1 hypothetical protein GCM10007079_03100 [Nocardiopsis terrae]